MNEITISTHNAMVYDTNNKKVLYMCKIEWLIKSLHKLQVLAGAISSLQNKINCLTRG